MDQGTGAEDAGTALAGGNWYRSLPSGVQRQIADRLSVTEFAKSEALFHQGGRSTGLHCILQGSLHLFGLSEAGDEALMAIVRPGEWTGFLAALDGGAYAFEARAAETTLIGTLPLAAMRAIFERDVATYKLLVAPQLAGTRNNYRQFASMQRPSPLQRIADQLIALGRWAYARDDDAVVPLTHISQALLAASVGLSRQTTNLLLGQLEDMGAIVRTYGEIRVNDAQILGRIAAG